jgi:hypothetical protein
MGHVTAAAVARSAANKVPHKGSRKRWVGLRHCGTLFRGAAGAAPAHCPIREENKEGGAASLKASRSNDRPHG